MLLPLHLCLALPLFTAPAFQDAAQDSSPPVVAADGGAAGESPGEGGEEADEESEEEKPLLSKGTLAGLKFRSIGPALMAGRISDIAIHPDRQSTWYIAVGSGGVWRTSNAGNSWKPIFDSQDSYSIGCITIDASNPSTIWVGSGENVSGRHVGYGDGIYRSLDGGDTWKNMGLKESERIGRIVIDPRDSNVLYVAAQGPLWSGGGERGVFKTTDGGTTWTNILSMGEFTGANEVVMDPNNPDVLYASMHQRLRTVAALMNGGPESSIQKIDGWGRYLDQAQERFAGQGHGEDRLGGLTV